MQSYLMLVENPRRSYPLKTQPYRGVICNNCELSLSYISLKNLRGSYGVSMAIWGFMWQKVWTLGGSNIAEAFSRGEHEAIEGEIHGESQVAGWDRPPPN